MANRTEWTLPSPRLETNLEGQSQLRLNTISESSQHGEPSRERSSTLAVQDVENSSEQLNTVLRKKLTDFIIFNCVVFFFSLLCTLVLSADIDPRFLFVLTVIYNIFLLFKASIDYRRLARSAVMDAETRDLLRDERQSFIEAILLLLLQAVLITSIFIHTTKYIRSVSWLICILYLVFYFVRPQPTSETVLVYLRAGSRLFLYFQSQMILLRLDGIVTWHWKGIFSPAWCIALVLLIYEGILCFVLIGTILYYRRGDAERSHVVGAAFLLLSATYFFIGIIGVSIGLCVFFEAGTKGALVVVLFGIMVLSVIMVLVSGATKKDVVAFFVMLLEKEQSDGVTEEESRVNRPSSRRRRARQVEVEHLEVPEILIKVSSTYFRRAVSPSETKNLEAAQPTSSPSQYDHSQLPTDPRRSSPDPQAHEFSFFEKFETERPIKESEPQKEDSVSAPCLVCYDRQPNAVVLNCGHGGICYPCGLEMWKKRNGCHLCRQEISQLVEIDLKKGEGQEVRVLAATVIEFDSREK